jgi:lipopolysaccharide/colanic/teichoic acid biosynthesis glycosyltransferase
MSSLEIQSLVGDLSSAPVDSSAITYPVFGVRTRCPLGKCIADRALAAILLIPALPLIGLLALLVLVTSGPPVIFRQPRVGKNGRTFTLYKIRTMIRNAEAKTGPVWAQANDRRVTRLGRVLRKFHLDELPQLFNVLKGDMSLVGPRPERPEFVHLLSSAIPDYLKRLEVPPGITGIAQLNLPPDTDLDSVRRKLALDLEYADRMGPWMDSRLLLCTFARLFKFPAVRFFGLYRNGNLVPSGSGNGDGSGDGSGSDSANGVATDGDRPLGLSTPRSHAALPKPR